MNKIKLFFSNRSNQKIVGIISLIIIFLILVIIPASFAQTTPIKSVEIPSITLSYENSEEGSWNITKSAEWLSKGKGRITIELDTLVKPINDYTDFILVLDTSGSMNAETTDKKNNTVIKLEQLKSDVNELIDYMIPKGSNVSLVTFSDSSTVVSDFTSDETILKEEVTNLIAVGETNYYQALVNVDTVLNSYEKQEDRDCVVLFLTDGLPTIDTPNEIGQYEYLKSNYPYLVINGVQYEMGEEPLENIDNITDNHYVADVDDLKEYLYMAAISPRSYEKLEITDYIESDYFNVDNIDSITSSSGITSLENNKVTWNLDGINSGSEETLEIDINLNDDLIGIGGVYQTNKNLLVTYKINDTLITENSTLTPILANNYLVIYEANAPDDCEVSNMPSSKNASVFDTIKIEGTEPVCEGYKFKEWQLVTEDVTQVNADYFIMPEKNVTLRAIWSKLSLNKSMEGTISKVQSLYQMMEDSSIGLDTDVSLSSGIYTIESTQNDTYPVHYYRGTITNNNLVFARFCWKIVRTTATGGVKLIYNGELNEDGQCLSDRENHIGYESKTRQNLSSNYYYGTSYTYDSTTSKFSLAGELIQATWDETTGPTLIDKFTCKNAASDGTCSKLYQVVAYDNETQAYVLPLNSTTHYTQIGESSFNLVTASPSDVGYMYDTRYPYEIYSASPTTNVLTKASTSSSSSYYYGNDIVINEDGTYTLQNKILNEDGETYTITESEQKIWSDNYSTLVGYYTCRSTSTTCSTVYYIAGTDSSNQYNVVLTDGTSIDDQTIVLGQTVTDNDDKTYTLDNPVTILKKDWFTNYSTYNNYYVCNDLTSTICDSKYKVTSTDNYRISYDNTFGFVYGNDVEWDGINYTLIDTVVSTNTWSTDRTNLATKYHYTCLNTTGICSEVYYISFFGDNLTMAYLPLSGVENIETAKTEMFTNDKNSTSSDIKLQVDNWYAANMTEYTEKLEDTIWCNDRTFESGTLKSKDTSSVVDSYFGAYGRNVRSPHKPTVVCPMQARDGFTVSTESGGNGALIYPVGLLTADELAFAGHAWSHGVSTYLTTGQFWWTMSPRMFTNWYTNSYRMAADGQLSSHHLGILNGVRPSVSLAPGTKSIDGDGSEENPFVIE